MRKAMEQMLYDNGVDIFFSGHIHAYEVRVFASAAHTDTEVCRCSGFERRRAKPAPCSAEPNLITQLGCRAAAHQSRLQLHPGPVRHRSHHGEGAQTAPMPPIRSATSAPLKQLLLSRHLHNLRSWPMSFAPRPAVRCLSDYQNQASGWLSVMLAWRTCKPAEVASATKASVQSACAAQHALLVLNNQTGKQQHHPHAAAGGRRWRRRGTLRRPVLHHPQCD